MGRFGLLLPACLLAVGVFFGCFALLCLALAALAALACFGLLGLLWLLALSVPLLLRFCLMLAYFFALVTHFFDILTPLKLSCNFLTFFDDFSSSFGGFGVVWGWILGGFFDDF